MLTRELTKCDITARIQDLEKAKYATKGYIKRADKHLAEVEKLRAKEAKAHKIAHVVKDEIKLTERLKYLEKCTYSKKVHCLNKFSSTLKCLRSMSTINTTEMISPNVLHYLLKVYALKKVDDITSL